MRLLLPLAYILAVLSPGVRAEDAAKGSAALGLLKAIDEGFVQVYEKVAPAVVIIEASKHPEFDDEDREALRGFEFFLDDGKPAPKDDAGEKEEDKDKNSPPPRLRLPGRPARSEGSGFIIRADGYVLTNNHVVADAERLEVRLKDGRTLPARLVGRDDKTDIAVLKIEASGLPVVEFGDSEKLRVGQLVCAIGAPFSQDYSFSVGWVSGKNRTNLLGPTSPTILYEDYIQTDAFINPGNSGGPLFDVEGKVVGMNTLINGLGRALAFAIPASMLEDVGTQLIATGKVQRPWLGIRIETLNAKAALRDHITGIEQGVIVDTVEADAPAYKSDLRPADVITEVDGVKVASARDLQMQILKKKIGQPLQLTVWRAGSTLRIPVATGELPAAMTKVANTTPVEKAEAKAETLGLRLRDAKPVGAQVVGVLPDSPAAHTEIFADDVITEVETKPVTDAAGCVSAIATALVTRSGKGVLLNIERKGKRTFVILPRP
jgi:S1-C subfamily serine protease